MAKTLNPADTTTSSPNGTKKQRKKQAKREAKTMLKLEQSRKDVQKAEQKVAKVQAQLESSRTRLHNLEAEIEKMHTSQHHSTSGTDTTSAAQPASTQVGTTEDHAYISPPTDQAPSLSPVEGRTDVLQDQTTSSDMGANNG